MTDFAALIRQLIEHEVEFIIVGGAAATAHGSARLTLDLDVVYSRSAKNIEKIVSALHLPSLVTITKSVAVLWIFANCSQ